MEMIKERDVLSLKIRSLVNKILDEDEFFQGICYSVRLNGYKENVNLNDYIAIVTRSEVVKYLEFQQSFNVKYNRNGSYDLSHSNTDFQFKPEPTYTLAKSVVTGFFSMT